MSDDDDKHKEDNTSVPSNQLADQRPPTAAAAATNTNNPPTVTMESDNEEDWHLLTQYIGPATPVKKKLTNNKGILSQRELDKFTNSFMERTDTTNRATNHKEALEKAISKGRTPQKLTTGISRWSFKKRTNANRKTKNEDRVKKRQMATATSTNNTAPKAKKAKMSNDLSSDDIWSLSLFLLTG